MSDGLKFIAAAVRTSSIGLIMGANPDLFIDDERTVYDFTRRYCRQYREVPTPDTIRIETGITLRDAPQNVSYYLDVISDRHEYNLIRESFNGLRSAMQNRNMEHVRGAIGGMSRAVRGRNRRGREVMRIDEAVGTVVEHIRNTRFQGGITGVTSGWNGFDEQTGGYQGSDIITWIARPSIGKTYVLLKQAEAAHEAGENVLFVTTEMGGTQIARRYVSIKTGLDPRLLKNNMVSTHMQRRIESLYRDMIAADRFNIFSVGMNASVSSIEALMQEYGPTVVFIDGVYLLRPTAGGRNMNRTERVSEVYDELKGINLDAEVPMILTSQFNRAAGKGGKEGTLETIGYSDVVGTHSSIVVAIKTGPTIDPWASREFDFLKGREGESGQIYTRFQFAPFDMDEFIPDERNPEDTNNGGGGAPGVDLDWMS